MSTSRTREKADGELFKSTGIDDNATSTAVTIDANENVLVGRSAEPTSANEGTGLWFRPVGAIEANRDGGAVIVANRKTSDGDIAIFRKNGTSVGSIGTYGSALYIASPDGSDAGLRIGNSYISPVTTTGVNRDAGIDLGHSNSRFKDLYLSGGVVFGPASASNVSSQTLDDYEEGTYTPAILSAGSACNATVSHVGGAYTKIGRLVTASIRLRTTNNGTATGQLGISLPFAVGDNLATTGLEGAACLANVAGVTAAHADLYAAPNEGTSAIRFDFKTSSTSNSINQLGVHQTANIFDCRVTITYMT